MVRPVVIEDQGLVIRRIPHRNSSLVVVLFCRDHGLLSCVAKGARRVTRTGGQRAALSGFHTVALTLRSRSPNALATLTGAEILVPRERLPFKPAAMAVAQRFQELIQRFAPPGDPQSELWSLTSTALDLLEQGYDPVSLLISGQFHTLFQAGYALSWESCAGCGRTQDLVHLSPRTGNAVCGDCGRPYRNRLVDLPRSMPPSKLLAWPPDLGLLSPRTLWGLYRVGRDRLQHYGHKPLASDALCETLTLSGIGSDSDQGESERLRPRPDPLTTLTTREVCRDR
ncbi:MAG: DNA repair protein RecO [Magnetococcales bacterium]|nr:DNA repair protein RecO [Magnetococcales bacterium]